MFHYSWPSFSYQYSQKILLTRQLAGTINQVVKSPKSGLYGQRQTSRHPKVPKQPEVIIEILFAEAKVLINNDPSAGAPKETLLRILLPHPTSDKVTRQRELTSGFCWDTGLSHG